MLLLNFTTIRVSQSIFTLHHVERNVDYTLMAMDGRCWLNIDEGPLNTAADAEAVINFMRLGFAADSPIISDWIKNVVLQDETIKGIMAAIDPNNLKTSSVSENT